LRLREEGNKIDHKVLTKIKKDYEALNKKEKEAYERLAAKSN
jgi:hypothetical protein